MIKLIIISIVILAFSSPANAEISSDAVIPFAGFNDAKEVKSSYMNDAINAEFVGARDPSLNVKENVVKKIKEKEGEKERIKKIYELRSKISSLKSSLEREKKEIEKWKKESKNGKGSSEVKKNVTVKKLTQKQIRGKIVSGQAKRNGEERRPQAERKRQKRMRQAERKRQKRMQQLFNDRNFLKYMVIPVIETKIEFTSREACIIVNFCDSYQIKKILGDEDKYAKDPTKKMCCILFHNLTIIVKLIMI